MKLIDILVEELPRRGGWPEGAVGVVQDEDDTEFYFFVGSAPKFDGKSWWFNDDNVDNEWIYHNYKNPLASDYTTAIITREQYKAALAAKSEGWIEWGGGLIPISTNTFVDVKFNNGDVRLGKIAGEYSWEHVWEDSNIIAYRLHQPQEAEQDKADLNECIGKDAAPVWNGEGLPPVGCFCEITDSDGMLVYGQGESGEVIAHVENTAVIRMSYGLGCFEAGFLRPLRTEAERNRDAAVEQMMKFATIHTTKSLGLDLALRSCYDAIASGKIPGVKLEGL